MKQLLVYLLCKIGWHSWVPVGTSLMLDSNLKRCRRCGCGHMDLCFGQAYVRYTPEQLNLLIASQMKSEAQQ
jgi:hypothetical protein